MIWVPGLVSTIIPVYNRERMLVTAVESELTQTYGPFKNIIVVGGATHETASITMRLVAAPRDVIRFIRQDKSRPRLDRALQEFIFAP